MTQDSTQLAGTVFIVDDEDAVRDSLALLMRSVGLRSQTFTNAISFLASYDPSQRGCLILDVRMPHMSGLDLQQELKRRGWYPPIIFITGHGDVPMAVEAMCAGATAFLQKPFNFDELIRRVNGALALDAEQHQRHRGREARRERYARLTPREREIAIRLCTGAANKSLASELGLSERTVETHRANILRKMAAKGVADLAQMILLLGLTDYGPPAEPDPRPVDPLYFWPR